MGHGAIAVLNTTVIDGPELAMAMIILVPLAVLAAVLYFVLREKARDLKKRALDLPVNYYRHAPPPLPARRTSKGPPDLGERR